MITNKIHRWLLVVTMLAVGSAHTVKADQIL